jgi:hypothetical protein
MNEAVVKVLMSICYRAGWRDGMDGKDLPTLKGLDETVNRIYANAIMAKYQDTGKGAE